MLQNLKIDIIYHETPSDFEFEFNLGGCCHCRVLNNTTASPKELIGCLSKAVNRSRVIIVVGDLNSQNGLYLLISKAIGRQLTNVSAEEYGIIDGSNTTVIEGSLPLVSTDGLLSGCIIESGPQSIILLPDEKILRKDIAENLIFQYISAVSRTPETDSVITPDSMPEKKQDENETVKEEPKEEIVDVEDDIAENTENNENDDVLSSVNEIFDQTEENISNDIETTDETKEFSNNEDEIQEVIIPEDDDNFFDIFAKEPEDNTSTDFVYTQDSDAQYDDDEEYENKPSSKDKGVSVIMWIIIGLMFIIIGILAYMLIYTPLKNGVEITEYVKQIFNQ